MRACEQKRGGGAARPAPTTPAAEPPRGIGGAIATRVLVEQLRAVDLRRLDEHVGRLAPDEQRAVDEALELVLGL
jgi:mRNA-degrading endonuclease toxin of MazEF toxin-antitoxin module